MREVQTVVTTDECANLCIFLWGYLRNHTPNVKFLCILTIAVARSFSAMCYVLPVLWMTSWFHTLGTMACPSCVSQRQKD